MTFAKGNKACILFQYHFAGIFKQSVSLINNSEHEKNIFIIICCIAL